MKQFQMTQLEKLTLANVTLRIQVIEGQQQALETTKQQLNNESMAIVSQFAERVGQKPEDATDINVDTGIGLFKEPSDAAAPVPVPEAPKKEIKPEAPKIAGKIKPTKRKR